MSSLDPKFIEWACSFSGCDGGNKDAEIWLSGIEWGGSGEEYYKKELPHEISQGKYTPSDTYKWENIYERTYTYDRNVAKLYTAIKGKSVVGYKDFVSKCTGDELFKLNLYPIAFRNTNYQLWKKYNLEKITGFQDKYLYQTWCFLNRFPVIRDEATAHHHPKVIIGTGISYLTDFLFCFAGEKSYIQRETIPVDNSSANKYERHYYWAKFNSGTTLFVIPFFSGQYGLNSNELIEKMGTIIKDKVPNL